MKIVITGATGFVGGAMMRYFSNKGHHVIGLGRNENLAKYIAPYGEFRAVDISKTFEDIHADVCIHSAALASDQARLGDLLRANVEGTKHVFNHIHCKKFIFISSSSVYNFDKNIQSESDPIEVERLFPYGKTKRLAELFLEDQQSNNKSISILRPRAIYGIGDRLLMPRLISKVKNNKLILPGNLQTRTSLTHIDNLIEAAEICMKTDPAFEIFNVADREIGNMRTIVSNIVNGYFESEIKMIAFPIVIAKTIAGINSALNIHSSINTMAIKNLTKDMILETSRISNLEGYLGKKSFDSNIESIQYWLKNFTLDTLKNSSAQLSWSNIDQ